MHWLSKLSKPYYLIIFVDILLHYSGKNVFTIHAMLADNSLSIRLFSVRCDPPFINLTTGCYYFPPDQKTWDNAEPYCNTYGNGNNVHLASPNTTEVMIT